MRIILIIGGDDSKRFKYHFVWVMMYRYKVLNGEVAERIRYLVRETYEAFEIRIVLGHVV